jgi:hypothetical protein
MSVTLGSAVGEPKPHTRAEALHDTSGANALVAGRFYYFGRKRFMPDGGLVAHSVTAPGGGSPAAAVLHR